MKESQRKWWVLIGVGIASFMGCLDFTIVNTALPAIQNALNASVNQLQWIINIFILALSALMVIMGRLADIYGRRKILYIGLFVFGISSLGAGISPSINWLILFRFVQGISCSILYTASGAIVANAFPENERGKAIGALFGVNGIGLAVGPVFGGILVSLLSWRWVFLVNVPAILLCFAICIFSVRESKNQDQKQSIDWWGLLFLMLALPSFIFAISQGEAWGWDSSIIIQLFIIALIAFTGFYFIEKRTKSPIIEFKLFANRIFISSVIATFSLALFYCLAFFLMPLYLHIIRGESDFMVGIMLLPTTAVVAILSPIVGRAVDRYSPKPILIIGFIFFTLSALMQANFDSASTLLFVLTAFILMGIGWSCILGPSTVASLSSVPESVGAVAMGSAWTLHNIGGAIGLSIGVAIYHIFGKSALLYSLKQNDIAAGSWVDKVIADPERATTILHQFTSLKSGNITNLFHNFFINGYHAAMWFLCISSFLTAIVILYSMRKKI